MTKWKSLSFALALALAVSMTLNLLQLIDRDQTAEPPTKTGIPDAKPENSPPKRSRRHHGDRDLPFDVRLKYYRAQQKARHFFRTGSAKRNFDEAYPPGTFTEHVTKQEAKSRLLLYGFSVRITTDELQDDLDRIQEKSRRLDILKALKAACDNNIDIMRHCMAEPIVVDRKLREIFNQRQDEIQTDRCKEIDGLRKGLTAENFKKRAGAAYRELTYSLNGGANPHERMTLPETLREILDTDLKQGGDISRLNIDDAAFRIYLLISKDETSMKVGVLEVRKLTYDGWVADSSRNYK